MTVAVVIVAWRSRRWLPGLLGSLARQTRPADELIVVDNGSDDGTAAWLERAHPEVDLVDWPVNRGFAAAANAGIARAGAELVALVNPDVELAPDWLQRLADRFADPGIAAATGKMVSLAEPDTIYDAGDVVRRDGACLQRGRGHRDGPEFDEPGETFGACAGAAVYRREAVLAVGGLHEGYFLYLEDADLALALRAAGWRCAYEPAVAHHAGEGSSPGDGAHLRWVARNTPLLVARWFPARWLGLVLYRQLALAVLAARERRLAGHLRAVAQGLALVPRALRDRPRPAIPRDALVPWEPIRGPEAIGHPAARAASWGRR